MPPIFSSNRIAPTGRSMPKLVPIPISPSREAPSSVASGRLQIGLAPLRARVHDAALAQLELDPGDLDAARAGGDREADAALGAALVRAGEDLAGGHVAPAVGVDPRAVLDGQREIGALGLDAQLARAVEAADQPVLEVAQLGPGRGRVVAVEEQRAPHEGGELGRAHAGLLRARRGGPQRQAPAARQRGLAHGRAGAGGARHPLGVDVGERARVDRRLDADRRVGGLRLGQLERRGSRRGGRRGRAARTPRRPRAARRGSAARPRARAARSCSASSSGAARTLERATTCWPGCTSRQ